MHQLEKPQSQRTATAHDRQGATPRQSDVAGRSDRAAQSPAARRLDARPRCLRCGPFTVLDAEALEDLIKVSSPAKFARRGLLYEQGSVADSVYVVASGRVRVVRAAGESRTLTVAYRVAGDLLGETALPDGSALPRHRDRDRAGRGGAAADAIGAAAADRPSGLLAAHARADGRAPARGRAPRREPALAQRRVAGRRVPARGCRAPRHPGGARRPDRRALHAPGDRRLRRLDPRDGDPDAWARCGGRSCCCFDHRRIVIMRLSDLAKLV